MGTPNTLRQGSRQWVSRREDLQAWGRADREQSHCYRREQGCASTAPAAQGLPLRGAALGLLAAAQPCWGAHAPGARLLQAPSRAGSSSGAEQLGASSGLSLRASLQAELTLSAAASKPERRCSAGDTRAQPLTCTISLQINLKFLIAVTSIGVQMTEAGCLQAGGAE